MSFETIETSLVFTPKRVTSNDRVIVETISPMNGTMFPWNWSESVAEVQLSPSEGSGSSPCASPESSTSSKENGKRGRPRADLITSLILQGSSSHSGIKCNICNRNFPREKSLQAHLRTHTGERPYHCDYPGCNKAFVQSGQLKTHQRLHTGEKPFICSTEGCTSRFTHANRHCPDHPYAFLRRDDNLTGVNIPNNENSQETMCWLQKYQRDKESRKTSPKSRAMRKLDSEMDKQANLQGKEADLQIEKNLPKCSPRKRVRLEGERLPVNACTSSGKPPAENKQDKLLGALALIQLSLPNEPLNLSMHQ